MAAQTGKAERDDARRIYYDHEPAYKAIAEAGGRGWDDLPESFQSMCDDCVEGDSYAALERFLASRWAPHPAGTRAIDLGCGGGQSSIILAEQGYEVVGVDFSETAIELARQNAEDAEVDCEFIVADVLDLDEFSDGEFGLVVDNHCLHCLVEPADRAHFLEQASRLLMPGGAFFSETLTHEGNFDTDSADVDPDTFINQEHTRIWASKIELDEALRDIGFNVMHSYVRHQQPGLGYLYVNYAYKR